MRAIVLHEAGGPELLREEDVPAPQPGPGEVLVRVEAVSINPIDFKTRQGGGFRDVMGPPPWVLGWDVSGVVTAVGSGTRFREGDAVFGLARFPKLGGTYAEYAAVPADQLALRPAGLDSVTAAAIPLVGLTAWQALRLVGLKNRERLLVLGGAGGVGHLAISIARAWGAEVAATASESKAALLVERGAVPLDYHHPDWARGVPPFDAVLNTVGANAWVEAHPAVRAGSRVIHIAGPAGRNPVDGVIELGHLVHPDAASLSELAALVVAGDVKPLIEKVYPMTAMAAAHARLETGRVSGKLVLTW